jgi:hypothetical protein
MTPGDSLQRRIDALRRWAGVTDAVLVVPAYSGLPVFAFSALTLSLAKPRQLVWTPTEFSVFTTVGGEMPSRAVQRVRRPVDLRLAISAMAGHDTWSIAGHSYKVAQPYRAWLERLDDPAD